MPQNIGYSLKQWRSSYRFIPKAHATRGGVSSREDLTLLGLENGGGQPLAIWSSVEECTRTYYLCLLLLIDRVTRHQKPSPRHQLKRARGKEHWRILNEKMWRPCCAEFSLRNSTSQQVQLMLCIVSPSARPLNPGRPKKGFLPQHDEIWNMKFQTFCLHMEGMSKLHRWNLTRSLWCRRTWMKKHYSRVRISQLWLIKCGLSTSCTSNWALQSKSIRP